jgi:two-component system, cell cycle response regulator CpdR
MACILLADDDSMLRDLVKRAFEADGHTVDVAHDGLEALDLLQSGRADILVSDVNMPGLDGISLAGKALSAVPSMRILLMSGFPEELERAKSIKGGRITTLSKPFTLDQIKAALKTAMG